MGKGPILDSHDHSARASGKSPLVSSAAIVTLAASLVTANLPSRSVFAVETAAVGPDNSSLATNSTPAIRIGAKAPDFKLKGPDGTEHSLYSLLGQGKIVLVDLWASWCGPCLQAVPKLKLLHDEFADTSLVGGTNGLEILSISKDIDEKGVRDWKRLITAKEMNWVHVRDPENLFDQRYGEIPFIPRVFLIDSTGTVIGDDMKLLEVRNELLKRSAQAKIIPAK